MISIKVVKLKRTLAALCVGCILLACVIIGSTMISAQSSAKMTASTVTAEKGSTVSVTITLNDNPGIWGIKFKVGYDHSALTLSSVANGTIFADNEVTLPETLSKEQYVYYACCDELKNTVANGTVVTLKFKVSENVDFNTYPITVSLIQAVNIAGKNVEIDIENADITVVQCIHNKIWRSDKAPGCETEGSESEVCSKCGESFTTKAIKATGHQNTEVKNKVAATKSAEGYTGDTYCKDCGKLLSQGKVIPKLTDETTAPAMIQGNGTVFDKMSNQQPVFVSSADFSTFIRVEIDGITLDKKYYTIASGSIVVTVSTEFLSTLSDGQHTIAIVSKDGTASAEFTVKTAKPEQQTTETTGTRESTKPDSTSVPVNTTTPVTTTKTIESSKPDSTSAPAKTTPDTTSKAVDRTSTDSTNAPVNTTTPDTTTKTIDSSAPDSTSKSIETSDPDSTSAPANTAPDTSNTLFIIIIIAVLCIGGLVAFIIIKRRRKDQ